MGGLTWPFMMLPLRCLDTRLGDDGDTDVDESIPWSCMTSSCMSNDILFGKAGKMDDATLARR